MAENDVINDDKRTRTIGITIIAYMIFITGICSLLLSALTFILGNTFTVILTNSLIGEGIPIITLSFIVNILGLFLLVSGILTLILSYGIWKLKNWARIALISSTLPNIALTLFISFFSPMAMFSVIPQIAMMYILFSKDSKKAFGIKD